MDYHCGIQRTKNYSFSRFIHWLGNKWIKFMGINSLFHKGFQIRDIKILGEGIIKLFFKKIFKIE